MRSCQGRSSECFWSIPISVPYSPAMFPSWQSPEHIFIGINSLQLGAILYELLDKQAVPTGSYFLKWFQIRCHKMIIIWNKKSFPRKLWKHDKSSETFKTFKFLLSLTFLQQHEQVCLGSSCKAPDSGLWCEGCPWTVHLEQGPGNKRQGHETPSRKLSEYLLWS